MTATIILHHGVLGFSLKMLGMMDFQYWNGIDKALARAGHRVIVTDVRSGGVAHRAARLKEYILRNRSNSRVVILAHSMGGMDARYMISNLDMADRVAALVTIGTGHRGSSYVEWLVRKVGECAPFGFAQPSLWPGVWPGIWDMEALMEATPEATRRLSNKCPDMPGVRYFSVSGVCPGDRMPPLLWDSHRIVTEKEGENDGCISLASSKWGERHCVWPVNHFHLINWPFAVLPNNPAEDVSPRYLDLVERLRGEGVMEG